MVTHPIQYLAPVLRLLARSSNIHSKVFYTWSQTAAGGHFDPGFGTDVSWDVPLLAGYEHEFVQNIAKRPGSSRFFGIRTPSLPAAISSWRADALLVYGWNNAAHLDVMRRFKGTLPVFFRGDSTLLDPKSALKNALRRAVLRWVYRHVDVAVSVGQNSRDYFQWCGIPRHRIALAPHCVDNARFEDADGRHDALAAEWRDRLGIREDELTFVFAGKLIPKKDPVLLLEALEYAGVAAHVVLFGSGELEAELRRRAANAPNVHLMPFQNQSRMPAVYRLGDVFVMPSRGPGETWGLALNEAMACRRPVIASSRTGAARDLVVEDVTGWTFAAADAAALARTLAAAAQLGRDRLRRLGEQAYRHIERWSAEESARRIEAAVTSHVDAVGAWSR